MSTVVVVKKSGYTCIAADSLITWGSTKESAQYLEDNDKILSIGDSYLGTVGDPAHQLSLQHHFRQVGSYPAFHSIEDIFDIYVHLHTVLKKDYFLRTNDDDDDSYESSQITGLIANGYGIFGIYPLRTVQEYSRFYAIGSGRRYALGAMYAAWEKTDSAREIARIGIEGAAEFDSSTSLPMTSYTTRLKSKKEREKAGKKLSRQVIEEKKEKVEKGTKKTTKKKSKTPRKKKK